MIKALVSHKSDNWSTPKDIYQFFIGKGYHDPCPLDPDGFSAFFDEWGEKNFVNPPYSDISRFIDKAFVEHAKGRVIVFLIPVRTGTLWFQKLFRFGCDFYFIRGRLYFGNGKAHAPFDSMFVAVTGSANRFRYLESKRLLLDLSIWFS